MSLFMLCLGLVVFVRHYQYRWQLTEFGAIYVHLFQSLFSVSHIDILWVQCQSEAKPHRVVLE